MRTMNKYKSKTKWTPIPGDVFLSFKVPNRYQKTPHKSSKRMTHPVNSSLSRGTSSNEAVKLVAKKYNAGFRKKKIVNSRKVRCRRPLRVHSRCRSSKPSLSWSAERGRLRRLYLVGDDQTERKFLLHFPVKSIQYMIFSLIEEVRERDGRIPSVSVRSIVMEKLHSSAFKP